MQPAEPTPQITQQFGLRRETGALAVDRAPDGPAAAAGIEPDDVIVGVDDQPVETVEISPSALRDHEVGNAVTVRTLRGDEGQDWG